MKHMKHGGENAMAHKGYNQGDMSPKVEDYQKPTKDFNEAGFSKTTQYIERRDKHEAKQASQMRSQHYQGRYN